MRRLFLLLQRYGRKVLLTRPEAQPGGTAYQRLARPERALDNLKASL